MSAQSFIYQIAGSKEDLNSFCDTLTSEIIEGSVNSPERLFAALTSLEKRFKEIKNVIKEECNINPKETPESYGWKFKQVERGVKYDYSVCNHKLWEWYDSVISDNRSHQKGIEETLKTLKEPLTIVNEETGEIEIVNPPLKVSTTTIEVS